MRTAAGMGGGGYEAQDAAAQPVAGCLKCQLIVP